MQYRQIFTVPRFDLCALLNLTEIVKNNGKVKRVPNIGVYNESFIRERAEEALAGIKKYYPDKFHDLSEILNQRTFVYLNKKL